MMIFSLTSEPFYLSHKEWSYTSWDRGVTQERDMYLFLCFINSGYSWYNVFKQVPAVRDSYLGFSCWVVAGLDWMTC